MVLFFFNLSVILFYIINFDLPKGSYLFPILWIILISSIISQFSFQLKKFHKKTVNFQFSISTIIFLFLLTEIAYVVKPDIFPKDIRMWVDKNKYDYSKVTEELDELPYVKFKSNTLLRTNNYRGTASQFSYEWTSDKYGFKNTEEIAKKKFFKAIAIGDSFTEGMGVDTDKTYPSILSKEGFLTYNLGVQGYSLSQSLGALKMFGNNFNYEYILINYCMGTHYYRDEIVKKYTQIKDEGKNTKKKRFSGGIWSFDNVDHKPEVRDQAYYVTSGIWLATSFVRQSIKNLFQTKIEVSNPKFKPYTNWFVDIEKKISSMNPNDFSLIEKPFLEINKFALKNNKKLIVIFHDYRGITYYEKATGKKLPKNTFEELNYLKNFFKKNNITLINFSKIAKDYVDGLDADQIEKKLPYLEIDGHFNEIGYGLLVQELKKIIN